MHPSFFCVLLALFLSACAPDQLPDESPPVEAAKSAENIQIFRDEYGTPHIVADTNFGVYFGYGYAVATDRMFQMEMLRRTVEGRVAEVLGSDYLELDKHVRGGYDHRAVQKQLAALNSEDLQMLEGYAQGFSKRVRHVLKNKDSLLAKEFSEFGFIPQEWSAYDVAMIFIGSIAHRYSDFNSELDNLGLVNQLTALHGLDKGWSIFNASKWLIDPSSPTTVPRPAKSPKWTAPKPPAYLAAGVEKVVTQRVVTDAEGRFFGTTEQPDALALSQQQISEHGFSSPEYSAASNFWAVKDKMQGVSAALVNGPQFDFGLPSYVYGIGLHGGDFNVVGNTLTGLPTMLFAHNNHIGWGSTAGMSDQVDVFREQLVAGKPEYYHHNGEDKKFERWPEVIKVRDSEDVRITARRSVHGMVQSIDKENGIAYARARAWEGKEVATLMAWINLAKDTTLDQAQARLSDIAANINFYTMDVQGNIAYTHGGRYPVRAAGHDSRIPAMGTGEFDWQGFRPYSENPTVRNPQQGYIVNWNNRPAAGWIANDLWPYTWSKADRSTRIVAEIEGAESLSVDDVWGITERVSYDDVSGAFLLPYLQAAVDKKALSPTAASAFELLSQWDTEWRPGGDGQYGAEELIIETWLNHLYAQAIKDDVGDDAFAMYSATLYPSHPLGASMGSSVGVKVLLKNLDALKTRDKSSYDFFNGANPDEVLRTSFVSAVDSLLELHGEDMSIWSLAPAPMVWKPFNFRGVPQASKDSKVELPAYMNRGSENNLFVVDGENFSGFDVVPPGQSGHLAADGTRAKHYADQMKMYSDFSYKSIPFSIDQVRALATRKELLDTSHSTVLVTMVLDIPNNSALSQVKQSLAMAEQHKDLGAFIHIDRAGAMAAALNADAALRKGAKPGPLQGVPIVVKDNIHVAGMPNTAGTSALMGFVPQEDHPVIVRLREAGAIILGKTNMHELAFGITSNNAAFGPVRNAVNPTRIAGGSSGGTAVAVAAGISGFGLGTDTGGSTRIPPALNGVVGFRPSMGRYPSGSVTPISSTRDTVGPITKTVAQLALLDCVIAKCDAPAIAAKLDGLRIGVPRAYFYENLSADVKANMESSLKILGDAGVQLIEVEMPGLEAANNAVSFPIVWYEVMREFPAYLKKHNIDYTMKQVIDKIESLDVKGGMLSNIGDLGISEEDYRAAMDEHRPQLLSIYEQTFKQYQIEALIVPTVPLTAPPIASSDATVELNGVQVPTFPTFIRNTDPISNVGLPSLTLPSGKDRDGLPIGIMLDGPANSDRRLIEIALALEAVL